MTVDRHATREVLKFAQLYKYL